MDNLNLRVERPKDYSAVLRLTYEAFLTLDYPGRRRMDEHFLIHLLQGTEYPIAGLSFVAEYEGEIIGHILYTHSKLIRADGSEIPTVTFGPLSVLPKYQRQSVGRTLVNHSMKTARDMGFGAVMITGVPDYYPKLGFRRGRDFDVTLPDGTSPDALMGYELIPGWLSSGGTLVFDANGIFEQAENDDAGFAAFHKGFMAGYYPGQLTLRPFFDADIDLMENWLYTPHVAQWYKHPDHWLHELRERRGEFSFIHHLIAEYEGAPIGFCQYYDTHFAQAHEIWNDAWHIAERKSEVYSIDYLIGEPEFLRRGFGKEMILLLLQKIKVASGKTVIVQPEKENASSCRALESAGFKYNGEDYVLGIDDL